MSLRIRIVVIVFFAAALALPINSAARAHNYAHEDLLLFKQDCTQCHKLKKIFKPSSPVYEGKYVEIVDEMQEKAARKKGKKPIPDADKAIIVGLFDAGTPEALKAALEALDQAPGADAAQAAAGPADPGHDAHETGHGKDSAHEAAAHEAAHGHEGHHKEHGANVERWIGIIESVHGPWQMAAFLLLGVYMFFSGLSRKLKRKVLIKFAVRKHVSIGRVYILAVLAGYGGGLSIWWLDGMDMGHAAPHFMMGTATAALFAAGGLLGLQLAAGKARNLKGLHLTCNFLATLLFVCQIVTGILLVLG